jgi:hypothetical protein
MNTTEKGVQLEDEIFSFFSGEIEEGRFFAKKECCRIFQKKGYYSKDRGKEIVFDISIEITLPGQKTHSILVLLECKNYSHKVPVDDVEEFYAKAQQISGANIKAIVVTTDAFQEGAFNFARSKGIGLLRYFGRERHDWVLTRSPSNRSLSIIAKSEVENARRGLSQQDYVSKYFDYYCFTDEIFTNSLPLFFSRLIQFGVEAELAKALTEIEQSQKFNPQQVVFKEAHEIGAMCCEVLDKVNYEDGAVPLVTICELLSKENGLEVQHNSSLSRGVLGTISFNPLIIKVDDEQAGSAHRTRFTLAHELGHLLLNHQRYMLREVCHESDLDLDKPRAVILKDVARMEWQANYFASWLLLPTESLRKTFLAEAARHRLVDRGHGLLYMDNQQCNVDTYYAITASIINKFCVSRSAVRIRLIELGLLNESIKPINRH